MGGLARRPRRNNRPAGRSATRRNELLMCPLYPIAAKIGVRTDEEVLF